MTKPWTRWQDWAEVVFGVVALLSPIWVTNTDKAMWAMIVLGALIGIDGLVSLAVPTMVYTEGVAVVLGVLLFIAPWVMSYSSLAGAAWSSWVLGVLTVVAGVLALPLANTAHNAGRGLAGQH